MDLYTLRCLVKRFPGIRCRWVREDVLHCAPA
jgi:hypothetical protein